MSTMIDCGSGVRLERAVRCTMSDGVVLVSDHYYPPAPGPHPTLLMRQPYGRDIASTVVYAHPVWFAAHGYNVVIQDVRGRGDSEGDFYPFRNEGRDGAETIRWLRTRSESNGSVGMYGFSYQGMTQLLAAAEQPEGLVCIAPAQTAVRSLSRLVLSSGCSAAGLKPGLGPADVESGCPPAQTARRERWPGESLGRPAQPTAGHALRPASSAAA